MKKRIITYLLSMVMICSFAQVSYAETEAQPEYSADYDFALTLGIMAEDIIPGDAIKRIELATCFTNILIYGTEPVLYNDSKYFNDVDFSVSGYADTVCAAGIMNGVGEGRFNPDGYVTYNQLVKAFVSFLGFDVKAQSMGGYPAGYMTVAAQLGILSRPEGASADDFVTAETVATMFKAAVNAPLFVETSFGDDSVTYAEDNTTDYLARYMDIERFRGVVKGVHGTNLASGAELEYNEIIVGSTVMEYNPEWKDLSLKLGVCADVYYRLDGPKAKILYFEEYNNTIVKVSGEEVGGYNGDNIVYYDGMKDRKLKIDGYTQVVYNNSLCTSYSEKVFNPWIDSSKDGSLTAVDNDSNGVYDYIMIDAYETYTVNTVSDNKIIPMYRENTVIDFGEYHDGKEVLIRNLLGEPVSLESIENGSVISVSEDIDGVVKTVVVTIDECIGVLDGLEVSDGIYYFTVDEEIFKSSNSLKNNPQLGRIEVGKNIKLVFNKDGLVSDIEVLQYQLNSIGYITDTKKTSGLEDTVMVKIFTSGGVFEIYKLAEKVTTFYGLDESRLDPEEVLNRIGYNAEGRLIRQPIYYRKNAVGEIDWMYICNMADGAIDGFYKMHGTVLPETPGSYEYNVSLGGQILVKGTTIFAVPSEEKRDDDDLYQIQKLYSGQFYAPEAYGTKKNSRVASVLVINDVEKKSFYNPLGIIVVSKASEALNDDGDPVIKIQGMSEGASVSYNVDKDIAVAAIGNEIPACGDTVRLTRGNDGSIIKLEMIFDESERVFPNFKANPTAGYTNGTRYLYGEIIWSDDESMNVSSVNPATGAVTTDAYLKATSYKYYKVTEVRNGEKELVKATPDDFMVYSDIEAGEKGPMIFAYTASGVPKVFVLYE